MELDDFIARVSTMSREEMILCKAELDLAIAKIQQQLESPLPHSTKDWKKNARSALRFKQVERDYVQARLNKSHRFVDQARRLLDPDTFNIIMEQANV